jgi:hypothetical protein
MRSSAIVSLFLSVTIIVGCSTTSTGRSVLGKPESQLWWGSTSKAEQIAHLKTATSSGLCRVYSADAYIGGPQTWTGFGPAKPYQKALFAQVLRERNLDPNCNPIDASPQFINHDGSTALNLFQYCAGQRQSSDRRDVSGQIQCFRKSQLGFLDRIAPNWKARADAGDAGVGYNYNPVIKADSYLKLLQSNRISAKNAHSEFTAYLRANDAEMIQFVNTQREYRNELARQKSQREFEGLMTLMLGVSMMQGTNNNVMTPAFNTPTSSARLVRQNNDGVNRACTYCCRDGYNFTITYRANQMCPATQ